MKRSISYLRPLCFLTTNPLLRTYLFILNLNYHFSQIRIAYEWTEDFVIKYLWSAAGYGLIAVPLLITRKRSRGAGVVDKEVKGKERRGRKQKSDADGIVAARTESECFGVWCIMNFILVTFWCCISMGTHN